MAENILQKMKEFFSVPENPVSNQELIEFKKTDPEGFAEVREEIVKMESHEPDERIMS